MSYAGLVERLAAIGVDEKDATVRNRLPGGFSRWRLTAMSDSDRSEFVALVAVACTAIIFLIGFSVGISRPTTDQMSPSGYRNEDQRAQQNISQGVTGPDDFDFWDDTFPQWAMAGFALIATGVSWRALYLLRETFKETRRTADAANVANRPWVVIEDIEVLDIRYERRNEEAIKEGLIAPITFKIRNTGKTPASVCYVYSRGYNPDLPEGIASRDEVLAMIDQCDLEGSFLSPGEHSKEMFIAWVSPDQEGSLLAHFTIGVAYTDNGGATRMQTVTMGYISRKDGRSHLPGSAVLRLHRYDFDRPHPPPVTIKAVRCIRMT